MQTETQTLRPVLTVRKHNYNKEHEKTFLH